MRAAGFLVVASALAAACGDNIEADTCDVVAHTLPLQAEDRYIIGRGSAYPANMMLRERERELYRSQRERREAAWETVAKVLSPVAIARDLPNSEVSTIPRWQTWYAKDDTTRIFQHLYEALSSEERTDRIRFDHSNIDDALGWNATELEDLENWPTERREAYLAAVDSSETLAGIGGVGIVGYSPAAMRHFLRSYPEMLSCLASGVPGAFVDTPGQTLHQALREPLDAGRCEARELGPFYVAEGESLTASVSGEGSELAHLSIHGVGNTESTECVGNAPCSYSWGAGAVYVSVRAGIEPLSGAIQIDYETPSAPWAACLDGAFSTDSVVVKASWQRAQFGAQLPVYDTSAAALESVLSSNASSGWGAPSREADPGSDSIYTIERPNGNRYRLAGLHIMSKELDHWQWITLWWSDTPDEDFGADRPQFIRELEGPWTSYKMCTVTMFDEGDPDPAGGYQESAPSLAAALASVHGGAGAPSWCSNPYIELGAGNMATNCIGCHQHGGTALTSETIIGAPEEFPHSGRTQLRNNFPHDYSWAPGSGDELALAFKAIVDFFE